MYKALLIASSILLSACSSQAIICGELLTNALETTPTNSKKIVITPDVNEATGSIEILRPEALQYIDQNAKVIIHGKGYKWTEGPLWIDDEKGGYLLFSDIPNNTIVKFTPNIGTQVYLHNSGSTGLYPTDHTQGSNGLLLNKQKKLMLLQQGDRRLAVMDAPLSQPISKFKTLSSHFNNKRLNSPNDGVLHSNGSIYFTDPPYGLKGSINDPYKELPFQGVYRLSPSGKLMLLDNSLKYPNGIALSLDEKTLYVAVSDEEQPAWIAYDVLNNGSVKNKRVFYDAKQFVGVKGEQGMPDGMALHSSGNLFATGPGGVWLFSPSGEVLAKIRTGKLTANCTLSSDEKFLYITAHNTVMSVKLR